MGHRVARVLVALALIAGMSDSARADFNIATGLKWAPLRYTFPVGVGSESIGPGTTNTVPVPGQWYNGPGGEMYGNHWQTTSLDNYIAFFFTEQIGLQLSLDLGWASHNNDATNAGSFSTSFFQVGIGVGAKFYLNRPTRERVSPYILLNLFKYFATVNTNDPNPAFNNDFVTAVAGFRSPVGGDFAFGAEYFFTTSFSLGAEVLGIRFAHVQGEMPLPMGGRVSTGENYVMLYTGISLNYRFLATASVHTYEEEEDRVNPRPAARRKRRPPPPPDDTGEAPPPPSPESVD